MGALSQPNLRRKLQADLQASRGKAEPPASSRRFANQQFVALMPEFVWAMGECCESPVEMKLLLHVMRLANDREPGNPGGWIAPILPGDAAELAGCSPQNLRCEGKRLFGDWSLLVRMEAPTALGKGFISGPVDPRAHTYRIRVDPTNPAAIDRFLKGRREAKRKAQEEAERAAAAVEDEVEEAERPPARRTSLLRKPVNIGPKAPLELAPESIELIRKCTAISSTHSGELRKLFIEDGKVLVWDFAPASSRKGDPQVHLRISPDSDPKKASGQTQRSASTLAHLGKDSLQTKDLSVSRRTGSPSEPGNGVSTLEQRLRDELDHRLMAKCGGSEIDDAIFGQVLEQLGPLNEELIAGMMALVQGSIRKIYSWPFLVTKSASAPSIATRARRAHERQKQLEAGVAFGAAAEAAADCRWCNGSGIHGQARESIPDALEAVKAGAQYCACPQGDMTRDLVEAALMRRSS